MPLRDLQEVPIREFLVRFLLYAAYGHRSTRHNQFLGATPHSVRQFASEVSPNGNGVARSPGIPVAEVRKMPAQSASLTTIEDFLAQKRIAMVGISRERRSDSVLIFEELCRRGYDVVPVNPNVQEALGQRCFARVQDIQPPVEAALLMTSPDVTDTVVADCAEAGIRLVWMYRGIGKGSVSSNAIAFCQERGITVIPGECPFMFFPGTGGVHRFHGFLRKLTGHYPRRAPASEEQAA
jgi:uncharacterized protein